MCTVQRHVHGVCIAVTDDFEGLHLIVTEQRKLHAWVWNQFYKGCNEDTQEKNLQILIQSFPVYKPGLR